MRSVGAERRIRLRTKEDKDNRKAAVLAQSLEVKETKEEYQDRMRVACMQEMVTGSPGGKAFRGPVPLDYQRELELRNNYDHLVYAARAGALRISNREEQTNYTPSPILSHQAHPDVFKMPAKKNLDMSISSLMLITLLIGVCVMYFFGTALGIFAAFIDFHIIRP